MQDVKRTSMDYLKTMHGIFDKEYKDDVSRHKHCQYKGKKGERYCTATTQKTCKRCRFFAPTTQSQLRIVVEKTEELKGKIKSRDMTIAKLKNEIERLKDVIELKDERILELAERLDNEL